MEIHQLRYFVAVADEGNFSRAAAKVRVAQPSLSQQIQAWRAKVFATPRDINTDHVNLSVGHFGKTRDHINKVLKSANITGVGIVHPAVDVDEKKGALSLANHVERSRVPVSNDVGISC